MTAVWRRFRLPALRLPQESVSVCRVVIYLRQRAYYSYYCTYAITPALTLPSPAGHQIHQTENWRYR